jgi:hypothetical protein
MIDNGSYCNGISKLVVEALGLSTWRIPELRHVEWVNSCGMLKITLKVRVLFTVDDYVDEVECNVLPLEVCGLLLGRPWQYDCNAIHAGRANTYSFMHDGKQRTLKPMRDDQIKSDVVLVVCKEKLHKAKPQPGCLCVDFTNLNKACPKDPYPFPRIDQIINLTTGCNLLCFLDAFSRYHQIKMAK